MLFTLLFLCNDRTDKQDNDYFRGNCPLKGQGLIKVVGITCIRTDQALHIVYI
jgi:hypothetical protein